MERSNAVGSVWHLSKEGGGGGGGGWSLPEDVSLAAPLKSDFLRLTPCQFSLCKRVARFRNHVGVRQPGLLHFHRVSSRFHGLFRPSFPRQPCLVALLSSLSLSFSLCCNALHEEDVDDVSKTQLLQLLTLFVGSRHPCIFLRACTAPSPLALTHFVLESPPSTGFSSSFLPSFPLPSLPSFLPSRQSRYKEFVSFNPSNPRPPFSYSPRKRGIGSIRGGGKFISARKRCVSFRRIESRDREVDIWRWWMILFRYEFSHVINLR